MNNTQLTPSIYPPPLNIGQSDVANSTEPQENVTTLPPLVQGSNGWEGSCTDFRVFQNVIKIRNTDAAIHRAPSEAQQRLTKGEDGIFSQHVQVRYDDPIYQWWVDRIGPYLGDWVLGKPRNENPRWKLLRFPDNYTLWKHKKGVDSDPANPRIDMYLHGAPHLGPRTARTSYAQLAPTVFRSPMEFVEHAIWLMRGAAGQCQCQCKYCTPGQSQRAINLRLNRGVQHDSDPESDDEDEDEDEDGAGSHGGAGRNATQAASSSSSRRRGIGTGAGAGVGARRGRRDRSPEITFKDYRVGLPGPSS